MVHTVIITVRLMNGPGATQKREKNRKSHIYAAMISRKKVTDEIGMSVRFTVVHQSCILTLAKHFGTSEFCPPPPPALQSPHTCSRLVPNKAIQRGTGAIPQSL